MLYQLGTSFPYELSCVGPNLFLRHDQTTRIHGPVSTHQFAQPSWHEIARPQVHGYDVLNVVFIDPLKFASIADEKVMRIFDAPRGFVELSEKLGVAHFAEEKVFKPSNSLKLPNVFFFICSSNDQSAQTSLLSGYRIRLSVKVCYLDPLPPRLRID